MALVCHCLLCERRDSDPCSRCFVDNKALRSFNVEIAELFLKAKLKEVELSICKYEKDWNDALVRSA